MKAVHGGNRRYQSVPPLSNGLNYLRFFRVIFEHLPQLENRASEDPFPDKGVGPDCLQDLLFGNGLAGVLGQTHEH
jgi:hypothetical protein